MTAFILSLLPIAILLVCLLILNMPAKLASAAAFSAVFIEFIFWFKPGLTGVGITLSKGVVMGVFVGLIAFGAMLLYNLVDVAGGFEVINNFLSGVFKDKTALFLMIAWTFSAFLQGIAGYGLPAVISATILIKSGFDAAKSAAASLLGHSWAITFGSMGSSIYAIDLVTDSPVSGTLVNMSYFGSLSMLLCGIGVCFILDGLKGVARGLKYVVPAWVVMTAALMIMARLEMVSVIGFVTGMVGIAAMLLVYKVLNRGGKEKAGTENAEAAKAAAGGGRQLFDSVLPYVLVIVFSIGFFMLDPALKLPFSFPGYVSAGGVAVAAEEDYVVFNIFKYPFTIILMTTVISVIYYGRIKRLEKKDIGTIVKATVKKIKSTEITLVLLLCTASIMMDAGMTTILSTTIVEAAGKGYAFMAAVIGVLGAFITGSNTNANILFGSLQETAALSLGMTPAIICAVQSVSASIGGAIGPTTTALAAAAADKSGRESEIYRYTLAPTLITAVILGIASLLAV